MTLRNATGVNSSTSAGGTTIVIPTGKTVLVRSDGTNVVGQFDYIANDLTVGGATNFIGNTTFGNRLTATYTQTAFVVTVSTSPTLHGYTNGETVAFINSSGLGVSGTYTITYINTTSFSFTSGTSQSTSGNCFTTNDFVTVNGVVNPGVIIDGSSTIPALRVTQTGSGNAFQVDDATNPDTTPFIIDNAGQIVTGYTAPLSAFSANVLTPRIQELGTDANGAAIGVAVFSTSVVSSFTAASLELARAYTTSPIGTFTAVPTDTLLGTVNFSAADGAKFRPVASIRGISAGAVSTTSAPGYLSISTIPALSTSFVERLRVTSNGNIVVGGDDGTSSATGNTIRAANVGSLGNTAGPNLTIAAGNGTGTGGSGSLVLQTAPPTTSGTTQPTMVDRLTIQNSGAMFSKYSSMGSGAVNSNYYYELTSNRVGTNVNTAQSIFGVGLPVLANTAYGFEMVVILTKTAGTTSHTLSLLFTGPTFYSLSYTAITNLKANPTTGITAPDAMYFTQSAAAQVAMSATSTAGVSFLALVKGVFSTDSTPGTFTPNYQLSAAPGGAYSTISGSYINVYPLSGTSIGGWV
jgi:hypothetical protein